MFRLGTNRIKLCKFLYTVRIKIKVIHIQRPIVLKSNDLKICMWHTGEEQLILFLLVPFLHQVCHAWPSIHCHWRWHCHDPLFASFDNWIKAPLTNSVMVWLLKLSHLMPGKWGDHFLSGKFWIARYLQLLLVLLRIFRAYLTRISRYLGIYLAMVRQDLQDMLHRCQLCVEIRGGYVEDVMDA